MQQKITIGQKLLFVGFVLVLGFISEEHFRKHMTDSWDVLAAFGIIGVLAFCALVAPKPQRYQ